MKKEIRKLRQQEQEWFHSDWDSFLTERRTNNTFP